MFVDMILRVGKRTVTEREAASLCVSSDGISQEETLGARKPERCLKRVLLGVHCGTFSQLPLRFFFEVSEKAGRLFSCIFCSSRGLSVKLPHSRH